MITSIRIENFRGIRSGKLTGLRPLTILTGKNGCGKSAILDALLIAGNPSPANGLIRAVQRHPSTKDGARWLIHQGATAVNLAARLDAPDAVRSVHITVQLPRVTIEFPNLHEAPVLAVGFNRDNETISVGPNLADSIAQVARLEKDKLGQAMPAEVRLSDPGIPVPLHTAYSEAVRQGREDDVAVLLRELVPDVRGLRMLSEEDDTPALYLTKSGGAVPASLSGDGIQSFLQLALELAATPGGMVLVEEPEVYQHPAAIENTARVLLASARRGVQTVITTHSLELIDSLVDEADEQDRANMAVYILRLSDGELRASHFAGENVRAARVDAEMDLR